MPITIEKSPDAPIVVIHIQPSTRDVAEEAADAIAEISRFLDEQPQKVFLVTDLRNVSLGLDDIIQAASLSARGQNALLHHPRIRENIYVLPDGLMKMAIKGLNSATFGQVKAPTFETVEEALEYCRERLQTDKL